MPKTKAPRTKKVTDAMQNGRAPHSVEINLRDRLTLCAIVALPTPSLKEGRRRNRVYLIIGPTQAERKTFGLTEVERGRFKWDDSRDEDIALTPPEAIELSAAQLELIRDVFALVITSKLIHISLQVQAIMELFFSEEEIDELIDEMDEPRKEGMPV